MNDFDLFIYLIIWISISVPISLILTLLRDIFIILIEKTIKITLAARIMASVIAGSATLGICLCFMYLFFL